MFIEMQIHRKSVHPGQVTTTLCMAVTRNPTVATFAMNDANHRMYTSEIWRMDIKNDEPWECLYLLWTYGIILGINLLNFKGDDLKTHICCAPNSPHPPTLTHPTHPIQSPSWGTEIVVGWDTNHTSKQTRDSIPTWMSLWKFWSMGL